MVSYAFTGLLGTGLPTFSTNVTDLEAAWIDGAARLYSAALPGPGAGYLAFDISGGAGPATLLDVQGYSAPVHHLTAPDILILPGLAEGGGNLIAAGLTPSGWASYRLTAGGGLGAALDTPFPFNPVAVAGFNAGGANLVYFAQSGASVPTAWRLADGGGLAPVGAAPPPVTGPGIDALAVAQAGGERWLLSVSAAGNSFASREIAADGSLGPASQITAAEGVGFSRPTEVASLALQGQAFAIVAGAESSSLSVFRVLPGGILFSTDHVVDSLSTRFAGATALATLQLGDRGYVAAGGADGGVEIFTLLPDGRLIDLMTIADDRAMSLDHVSALTLAQAGGRTQLFAASATEGGITQIDLSLGLPGVTVWQQAGVISGGAGDDILAAGASTTEVRGGGGDDLIVGGGAGGGALLYGGAGADRFVLSPSAQTIRIMDYQPGIDRLDLTAMPMLRSLSQLTIASTATGADIAWQATIIHIESFEGNPIPVTAFAEAQMLALHRFAPALPDGLQVGTGGNDVLSAAAAGGERLFGLGGNDSLLGGGGNDVLDGGAGNDTLAGGDGADQVTAGMGNDLLAGETGDDWLDGGDGRDRLDGGAGNDTLLGGAGEDFLSDLSGDNVFDGGGGNDTLLGGVGNDALAGGTGNDCLGGDAGDDTLWGETGDDLLGAGAGNDIAYGDAGNDTLYGVAGDDGLYGGDGNDQLWAGDGNDALWGGAGADTLGGGAGSDILHGEDGNDLLYGSFGDDALWGENGNDLLYGHGGNDILDGGTGADTLWAGDGDDQAHAGEGNDQVFGEAGNDALWGGAGDDLLGAGSGNDVGYGDAGNDTLYGAAGDDGLYGGTGNDQLWAGDGNDTLWGGAGADTLGGGAGSDILHGEDGNDLLYGSFGDDALWGENGNDLLCGHDGNDSLYGGGGNDSIVGGEGRNLLDGGDGNDMIEGGGGADLIQGGNGNDMIAAGGGSDTINGGAGNDLIRGGTGADVLWGGAGADTFTFSGAAEIGLWATADVIEDFTPGKDRISLAGMGLRYGGTGAAGRPGEVRAMQSGAYLVLHADANGDGHADFSLYLHNVTSVSASDFIF